MSVFSCSAVAGAIALKMREHATQLIVAKRDRGRNMHNMLNYNPEPFLREVVLELTLDNDPYARLDRYGLGACDILVRDGMPKRLAKELGHFAYRDILTSLRSHMTDEQFANIGLCQIDVCNGREILWSFPSYVNKECHG